MGSGLRFGHPYDLCPGYNRSWLPKRKLDKAAGRHAIQHFYYQRVGPGVETTVWYEESGAVVHMTWYLESQTVHRFAALPAWLAEDMTVYRGDNQDPAFLAKIIKLSSERPDWPRHLINDDGFFRIMR